MRKNTVVDIVSIIGLTIFAIVGCSVSVWMIPKLVPILDGFVVCTPSGCTPISISVNGGALIPILRLDALFAMFLVGFFVGLVFWLGVIALVQGNK